MKRTHLSLAAICLASCLAAGLAQAQTKWDLASAYPANNFHTENLLQFANDVEHATAGKLKITVHANASLFKATEIKRAVQGGQTQAGEVIQASLQNEWQIYGADGLPFLADSYDESVKLQAVQRPMVEKKLADQGLVYLYSVAWPPQGIFTKTPIGSVADLKGVKWRAYSPATARIADLVKAQPVTVQAAELSQALATGVVEATMTSGATGVDGKLYEHLKYYYDVQAWLPKNMVIANRKAFDALDKTIQTAVMTAAAAAQTRGLAASQRVDAESKVKLKANGMQVLEPSAQLKSDMKKVGDVMLKEWLENSGVDGQTLLTNYKR
jgi:TRAP-type C4-dicarboxylate transport system substrate-binding protein